MQLAEFRILLCNQLCILFNSRALSSYLHFGLSYFFSVQLNGSIWMYMVLLTGGSSEVSLILGDSHRSFYLIGSSLEASPQGHIGIGHLWTDLVDLQTDQTDTDFLQPCRPRMT